MDRGRVRIGGLDGLRGLAALGVLGYHYTTCYEGFFRFRGSPPFLFQFGMYGVQLFFFISGFVIFMTVGRSKRPIDFAVSRFCRIYPAFWLALGLAVVLLATTDGPEPFIGWGRLIRRAVVGISMISGWFHIGPISGVYWTLEIEMGFYAIIFALLVARKIAWTVPVLSALVAVGVVNELVARYRPNPISELLRTAQFLTYLHQLLIGVLISKIREAAKPGYLVLVVACLFVPFSQDPKSHEPGKEAIVAAVLASVVWLATTGRLPWLNWRPFVFLGSISYSLYLNHSLMGDHIIFNAERAGFSAGAAILLATIVALVLAVAITKLIEEPVSAALKRQLRRAG